MKFRDDINPANTWVTSDTHFGHDNIVGFCHRPGYAKRDPDNYGLLPHEEIMLSEWRKEVPDDATFLHCGGPPRTSCARPLGAARRRRDGRARR